MEMMLLLNAQLKVGLICFLPLHVKSNEMRKRSTELKDHFHEMITSETVFSQIIIICLDEELDINLQ